nr:hypothetical protein [Tanacetum cinerariifolium]
MERGAIIYDDMTYSMLHETMKKKFNLEVNERFNLSVNMPSFDSLLDIINDDEHNFTKPGSSFAFGSYDENEDKQNDCFDGVYDNPQPFYDKWKKFMSIKPEIPETTLYKSKLMISKHYNKDLEVKIGNTFDNKEALDLAIRLKALKDVWIPIQ